MGLFGKSNDSKARIEELKKKIQAEQASLATAQPVQQPTSFAQPMQQAPQPIPQPVPVQPAPVQQAMPFAQPMQPAQTYHPVYQQPQPMSQPVYAPRPQPIYYEEPRYTQQEPVYEEEPMEEIKTGIILDLGEGMSLNLPIRSRMRLDEFLHIADRVRELQKIQNR